MARPKLYLELTNNIEWLITNYPDPVRGLAMSMKAVLIELAEGEGLVDEEYIDRNRFACIQATKDVKSKQ